MCATRRYAEERWTGERERERETKRAFEEECFSSTMTLSFSFSPLFLPPSLLTLALTLLPPLSLFRSHLHPKKRTRCASIASRHRIKESCIPVCLGDATAKPGCKWRPGRRGEKATAAAACGCGSGCGVRAEKREGEKGIGEGRGRRKGGGREKSSVHVRKAVSRIHHTHTDTHTLLYPPTHTSTVHHDLYRGTAALRRGRSAGLERRAAAAVPIPDEI